MRLGRAIKALRFLEQKDVRTLAREIGVSPATISRLETGKTGVELRSYLRILNWLIAVDDEPVTTPSVATESAPLLEMSETDA